MPLFRRGTVLTERISQCPHCGRTCLEPGHVLRIEAARNQTGNEEAMQYFLRLATASSAKLRRRAADVVALLEEWGLKGELEIPFQQRQLEGDLWEIKTPLGDRFPYYEFTDSIHGRTARLTHGFDKEKGQTPDGKAPRTQIRHGLWVIDQDRSC